MKHFYKQFSKTRQKLYDPGSTSDYGAMFAMAVVSLIPILIIFFIFQKQLVEGIATSGLKG